MNRANRMPSKRKTPQPSQNPSLTKELRINRILSLAGIASRRKADDLLKTGRIMINGRVVKEPGVQAFWGKDQIKLDGKEIPRPSQRIYLMLNKPFGYICSLKDPEGRHVVTELLRDIHERVYPVGRLDFDSLGLLLLTNDGEWAHRLAHPRYHVPKTYKVTCQGLISEQSLQHLKEGIHLEDGFIKPSQITLLERNARRSLVRMTITSGRSRVIRRMLEALGHEVLQLIRIGFGVLELGDLKIGQYRHLENREMEAIKKMIRLT
jgi:23S rRNA pseudouridine2605 synthase